MVRFAKLAPTPLIPLFRSRTRGKAFCFYTALLSVLILGCIPSAAQQADTTVTNTRRSGTGVILPDSGETDNFLPPEKPVFVPDSVEQPEIEPDTFTIVPESDSTSILLSVPYDDTATGTVPAGQILEPDTSYRFWTDPFWGIGIGWTLGGMPIYEAWRGSLIDESSELPAFTDWVDSIPIRFTEITAPDEYHTAFPIGVTFIPFVSENSYSAVDLDFRFMTKTQELRLESDSIAVDFWNRRRNLRYFDGTIGLSTHLGIHPRYFSVKEVDRTSLVLGVSLSPLSVVRIAREDSSPFLDTTFSATDMYYGLGVSWKIGFSTLRQTSPGRGLEIGTMYTGLWRGAYSGENDFIWGRLDPKGANAFDPVRFVTHRFHLYIRLLLGNKPPKIARAPEKSSQSTTDTKDTASVDTSTVDTLDNITPFDAPPQPDSLSNPSDSLPDIVPSQPPDTVPSTEPSSRYMNPDNVPFAISNPGFAIGTKESPASSTYSHNVKPDHYATEHLYSFPTV